MANPSSSGSNEKRPDPGLDKSAAYRYVLITPARNEGAFLERTAESVISQTIIPLAWVIVDDGSTDHTWQVACSMVSRCDFVRPVHLDHDSTRSFASKVIAFNAGFRLLNDIPYEFVGNLDADVTLPADYYLKILQHFATDPSLGLAGGRFYDREGDSLRLVRNSPNSVRGAVQLFRRQCFVDIGGYAPFRLGGIDSAAEYKARLYGWRVRTYTDVTVIHNRQTGASHGSRIRAGLRRGAQDYSLGYHPLFEMVRCGFRAIEGRCVLPAAAVAMGYIRAWLHGQERQVDARVAAFVRKEQRSALLHPLQGRMI